MDCEILSGPDVSMRAKKMLNALIQQAPGVGINPIVTEKWSGNVNLLMTYGLGHAKRRHWTEAHLRAGGRLIGWDLAYWDREESMRCTVDNLHPWRLIKDMPDDRWQASGISLRNDYNKEGPIILVGMGKKSRDQFAMLDRAWERGALKRIKHTYPDREIIYKPKRPEEALRGCRTVNGSIEPVLNGASLVVCRHSNVGVDACIAGIPVVCEDGAAKALYGDDIQNPYQPPVEERTRFLRNLSYWQWKPSEAKQAWKFLLEVLG